MKKPSVLLIYTGGTIGMMQDVRTGELKPFNFKALTKQIPELEKLIVNLADLKKLLEKLLVQLKILIEF